MFTLNQLQRKIEANDNFSFIKLGDGEMDSLFGAKGENCDGHTYTPALASALSDSFKFLSTLPSAYITRWKLGRENDISYIEKWIGIKCTEDHDILLNRVLNAEAYNFWKSIKDSKRKKIFVGPKSLIGVVSFLNIDDYEEIPDRNAFDIDGSLNITSSADMVKDNSIYLFCASMATKVWIGDVLLENENVTCLDCGSAFDPIFIGQTRTNQMPQEQLIKFYKELL